LPEPVFPFREEHGYHRFELEHAVHRLLADATPEEAELYLSYLIWPPGSSPPDRRLIDEWVTAQARE